MMKQNMPPLGRVSTLTVERLDQQGAWLMSDPEPLLLPQAELVPAVVAGERVRVFVYRGEDGKVLATRRLPQAEVGSFAALRIKEIQPAGIIFDLGRGFELPVAIEEIPFRPRSGERTLVRIELDEDEMLCGSCQIADFLGVAQGLRVGQQVDLQVWRQTDLGIKMIIGGRCEGLLYADDAPKVQVGQHLVGYVSRLREDGKVDLSLNPGGQAGADIARERILQALADKKFLPLTDHSSPEEIRRVLGVSKKQFKRASGNLYKQQKIELTQTGIRLKNR